jgi:hypothetical protein
MAIKTRVERIDLTTTPDLKQAIVDTCDIMAQRNPPSRLVAGLESQNQVILIFQSEG